MPAIRKNSTSDLQNVTDVGNYTTNNLLAPGIINGSTQNLFLAGLGDVEIYISKNGAGTDKINFNRGDPQGVGMSFGYIDVSGNQYMGGSITSESQGTFMTDLDAGLSTLHVNSSSNHVYVNSSGPVSAGAFLVNKNAEDSILSVNTWSSNAGESSEIAIRKSKSNYTGSLIQTESGNDLGNISFYGTGSNGQGFSESAGIYAMQSGIAQPLNAGQMDLRVSDNVSTNTVLSLRANKDAIFAGNIGTSGGLTISGNSTFQNNLIVSGNTTSVGSIIAINNVDVRGNIGVSGNSQVRGNQTISGNLVLDGTATISGATSIQASLSTAGSVNIQGTGVNNLSAGQLTVIGKGRNVNNGVNDVNLIFGDYPNTGSFQQLVYDASASRFSFTDDVRVTGDITGTGDIAFVNGNFSGSLNIVGDTTANNIVLAGSLAASGNIYTLASLGIGTNNPLSALELKSDTNAAARFTPGSNYDAILYVGDVGSVNYTQFMHDGGAGTAYIRNRTTDGAVYFGVTDTTLGLHYPLRLYRNNGVLNEEGKDYDIRVEGSGDQYLTYWNAGENKVGMGTNVPTRKLSLIDSADAGLDLGWASNTPFGVIDLNFTNRNASGLRIGTIGAYPVTFMQNSTPAMYINTAQKVAVGHTAPLSTLDVMANSNNNGSGLRITRNGATSQYIAIGTYTEGTINSVASHKDFTIQNSDTGSGGIKFNVRGTNSEMYLTSGGNLGIGTTTPTATNFSNPILELNGTSPGINFNDTNGTPWELYNDGDELNIRANNSSGATIFMQATPSNGSYDVVIDMFGYATGGSSHWLELGFDSAVGYRIAPRRFPVGFADNPMHLHVGDTHTNQVYLGTGGFVGIQTSTPQCTLSVNGAYASTAVHNVSVTGSPTTVYTGSSRTILISSLSSSHAIRLVSGTRGQELTLINVTALTSFNLVNGDAQVGAGSTRLGGGNWTPGTYGAINLICTGSDWIETSRS